MKKTLIKSLYGSVALLKAYCKSCKSYAFLIDGELKCCGEKIQDDFDNEKIKRECRTERIRTKISQKIKQQILIEQENRCIYCENVLNEYIYNTKKERFIKNIIHFDHFVAWIYSGNNQKQNLFASCSICNHIKYSKHFYNLESAKEYILNEREKKGF